MVMNQDHCIMQVCGIIFSILPIHPKSEKWLCHLTSTTKKTNAGATTPFCILSLPSAWKIRCVCHSLKLVSTHGQSSVCPSIMCWGVYFCHVMTGWEQTTSCSNFYPNASCSSPSDSYQLRMFGVSNTVLSRRKTTFTLILCPTKFVSAL